MGTLDLSKFGLSNKSWKLVSTSPPSPPPPPLYMGILDFSKFRLSNKSWKLVSMSPPNGNFGFKQIWTQQQKLEIGFHKPPLTPPPPHCTWEFWILANLDSATKVGNWFPRVPPPRKKMGTLDSSKFGLSN